MELNEQEIADLRYLREFYDWDDTEARKVMESIRATEHGAHYYTVLAAAHRAGYRQTEENGYIRLHAWCFEQGLPDPFRPDCDREELDAMATAERLVA